MRNRAEILGDGLEAVNKETVLTQSDLRLTLLILEVLIDIRDTLTSKPPAQHILDSIKELLQ